MSTLSRQEARLEMDAAFDRALEVEGPHSLQREQRTQRTQNTTSVSDPSRLPLTSVGSTSVGSTSVGSEAREDEARALAVSRGRPETISRIEAQRWQDLLDFKNGLILPVSTKVAVPTHAGPVLRRLAASLELLLGLREANGGLGVREPFTFARSNPKRPPDVPRGFGEAWAELSSNQVGDGLKQLRKYGSIEKTDPPPDTDARLLAETIADRQGKARRHTPPNFWRLVQPLDDDDCWLIEAVA